MAADDEFLIQIERFNRTLGGGVVAKRRQGGYTLCHQATNAPVARLRPTGMGDLVSVLFWSHKGKWSQVGDFGGVILPLDEALTYVAGNAIFWAWV